VKHAYLAVVVWFVLLGLATRTIAKENQGQSAAIPWVEVAQDNRSFVLRPSDQSFLPWGFNYDHDENRRLLEDYWDKEWPKVEADFQEMKQLGANVVRAHLQFSKFMTGPDKPNDANLNRLDRLVTLAERLHLYLDITGLGCYHKQDVPEWYNRLGEEDRWNAQARFWAAVAGRCTKSPAIFCYDLMNEPVVPGGSRKAGDWLGPPFAGSCFVQFVTLDQKDRPRPAIARQWCHKLVTAIRKHERHPTLCRSATRSATDFSGLMGTCGSPGSGTCSAVSSRSGLPGPGKPILP
jgi:hypothetical protein